MENKAEQLVDEIMFNITFHIKQELDVSVIPAAKIIALLCISKQLELLRYLGSKDSSQLYDELINQMKEVQKL